MYRYKSLFYSIMVYYLYSLVVILWFIRKVFHYVYPSYWFSMNFIKDIGSWLSQKEKVSCTGKQRNKLSTCVCIIWEPVLFPAYKGIFLLLIKAVHELWCWRIPQQHLKYSRYVLYILCKYLMWTIATPLTMRHLGK